MALGAIAIVTGIGGFFGGFVAGALSRQPEINELKNKSNHYKLRLKGSKEWSEFKIMKLTSSRSDTLP
jgi:hypothetical protein